VKLTTLINRFLPLTCVAPLFFALALDAQTTKISTEYLMTIYAPEHR
jgi:hypothetical protein